MVMNDDDYTFSDDAMGAGGFEYYEITTKDPGPFLLLGTLIISILLYCLLPFMVACGKRRERRRLQRAAAQGQGKNGATAAAAAAAAEVDAAEVNSTTMPDASSVDGGNNSHHHISPQLQQQHQEASTSPATPRVAHNTKRTRRTARGHRTEAVISPSSHHHHHHHHHHNGNGNGGGDNDNVSVASSRSSASRFVNEVLTGVPQTHGLGRRRPLLEKRLRRMEQASTHHFVPEDLSSMFLSPTASVEITTQPMTGTGGAKVSDSELCTAAGEHEDNNINNNKFDTAFDDEVSFGNACQGFGGEGHGGDDDDDAPAAAAAAAAAIARRDGLLKARLASKNNVRYKPPRHIAHSSGCMSRVARAWDALLQVVEWDYENKRIAKLACPYIVQALVGGIAEATRVAVVGRFYGTRELSAYVIVDALVGLTMGILSGIHGASGVLCCQSIGTGQTKLTGQYAQLSVICFIICCIPFSLGWTYAIGPTLDFMGFDARTVQMGVDFTKIYVWAKAWHGVGDGILMILDITDHEIFGTVFAIFNEVSVTLMMLLLSILSNETATLVDVGYFMIGIRFLNVVLVILIIACKGWWRKYYPGMIFSCALLNYNATKAMVTTAMPLSFGYLLAYGEWEILTFFAAFLGPAEVSAWSVLGTVWDVLEETTEAVAEAGEVRCAFLLGAGRPYHAAMSAAKSTVFAFVFAVLLACIVLICGDNLAVWMTTDPTLQKLVADLIPLFALGNVTLTVGTMAWTLVGAQGRYALSTSVGFIGSWCLTIPLAAVFTIWLEVSLQGQTSAVVIGYMVSGTWNTYYLLMSDWKAISEKVVAYNNANGIDLDSDQESSSNGNSSISSADE